MAGSYLDTNLVVAALTAEPFTETAQPYLLPTGSTGPVLSDWTVTEFSAALSIKVRVGALSAVAHEAALAGFRRYIRDAFECLPVTRADFHVAAGLADKASTGLRAGDALHLAVASLAGLVIHTLDQSMAVAAEELGIDCRLVRRP
ncbi:MAG: type II toxin-antitoxin system VapC family toxin [Geodermatophilaceae bacterium]|nr:type II toxin-antitoxin system VapC family toxin [Geodermatophilaceae bacterium]